MLCQTEILFFGSLGSYQFVEADIDTCQNPMAEILNSNRFDSSAPKASDMHEYQKHLVDSMKEGANAAIPKADCRDKIDRVKINKSTLKLMKRKNVNSDDSISSKNCHQKVAERD